MTSPRELLETNEDLLLAAKSYTNTRDNSPECVVADHWTTLKAICDRLGVHTAPILYVYERDFAGDDQ